MAAEIVNLRQARKAKARVQKDKTADENRRRFGRTKAERRNDEVARDKAAKALDGHKRDSGSKA